MAKIIELAPRQVAHQEPAQEARAHAARSKGDEDVAFAALARLARQWEHLAREADPPAKDE